MKVEIREATPEFGVGEWDRVLLFVYAGAIPARSNDLLRQAREAYETRSGAPGGILIVVAQGTQAPEGSVRQEIIEQMKAAAAKGWSMTLLAQLENRFAMVAVKSVLAALCFFSVINIKANGAVEAAAAELASQLKPPPGPDFARGLAEALQELRARMTAG